MIDIEPGSIWTLGDHPKRQAFLIEPNHNDSDWQENNHTTRIAVCNREDGEWQPETRSTYTDEPQIEVRTVEDSLLSSLIEGKSLQKTSEAVTDLEIGMRESFGHHFPSAEESDQTPDIAHTNDSSEGEENTPEGWGTLNETYSAAISSEQYDPSGETLVGVVARPKDWFTDQVDENRPDLAPPYELFAQFQKYKRALLNDDRNDKQAHNITWDRIGYADHLRNHYESDAKAQSEIVELIDRLQQGEDITLVGLFGQEKRAPREVLESVLIDRMKE